MPPVEFSNKDLLRSKTNDIVPGWYRVHIDNVTEAISKAGDSTNYVMEATILKNSDNGSEDFAGVPTPYWNFNDKAKGFMVGFFASLGIEVKAGARYDLSNAAGKDVDVYIERGEYQGSIFSRINHKYRKPRD